MYVICMDSFQSFVLTLNQDYIFQHNIKGCNLYFEFLVRSPFAQLSCVPTRFLLSVSTVHLTSIGCPDRSKALPPPRAAEEQLLTWQLSGLGSSRPSKPRDSPEPETAASSGSVTRSASTRSHQRSKDCKGILRMKDFINLLSHVEANRLIKIDECSLILWQHKHKQGKLNGTDEELGRGWQSLNNGLNNHQACRDWMGDHSYCKSRPSPWRD